MQRDVRNTDAVTDLQPPWTASPLLCTGTLLTDLDRPPPTRIFAVEHDSGRMEALTSFGGGRVQREG